MGLKSWYDDHVLPRLVTWGCSQRAIAERRAAIVPLAEGRVFELGCGGGLNQPYYDSSKVTEFAGIDPNGRLLGTARALAHNRGWAVDIRQAWGEDIPFASGAFDTVVCTYTMCSVANPARLFPSCAGSSSWAGGCCSSSTAARPTSRSINGSAGSSRSTARSRAVAI